jgi:hypothetical protein
VIVGGATTVVVAVAELFPGTGSLVEEETVAVFDSTVPPATPAPTLTTSVKAELPVPSVPIEQETVPPAPTTGVVQLHPPGADSETKAVPTGSVSERLTLVAALGPAFATLIV